MTHLQPGQTATGLPLPRELDRAYDAAKQLAERLEILGPEWEPARQTVIALRRRIAQTTVTLYAYNEPEEPLSLTT